MAPKDTQELELMMDLSEKLNGPVAIRYPRGNAYYLNKGEYKEIEVGKYEIIEDGKDIAILAINASFLLYPSSKTSILLKCSCIYMQRTIRISYLRYYNIWKNKEKSTILIN